MMTAKKVYLSIQLLLFSAMCYAQSTIHLTLPNEESPEVARIFRELIVEFNAQNGNTVVLDVHDSWNKALGAFVSGVRQKQVAGILVAKNSAGLDLKAAGLIGDCESLLHISAQFFDRFIPRYLAHVSNNNKHYGIPLYCTVPVMYYNVDKIQRYLCSDQDFSEVKLPKSWQELEGLLLTLRSRTDHAPMLIGGDWYEWIFETMVLQNGAALSNNLESVKFDSPEAIATLKYWQKLWEAELIDTTNSWKATINNFKYENYPIISYSNGAMKTLSNEVSFHWAAAAMPGSKVKTVAFSGASLFFSTNMNAAQKQIANKFVSFLYQKDVSLQIANATGLIAVNGERMGAPRLSKTNQQNALKQIETAKPTFVTYQYDKMRKLLKDAISRVFSGKFTVEQSLARAQREAMHVLAP
jgi:sn-glycerol 3-phosphate transport system substrate-binding protein